MEENNNLKNEVNADKKVKTRKIGRFTFGIVLILVGALIFIQTFTDVDTLRYIFMLSPIIFISLGIEVLILSRKNDIKYDFIGVILTFLTLGAGWIFAGINYGVNKILYDDTIANALIDETTQDRHTYYFDGTLELSNLTDKKIDLKVIENNSVDDVIVYLECNYKKIDISNNIIEYLISNDNYNKVLKNIDYENNLLMFVDIDEDVESIEIKVITNNKDNIKYGREFNLI